MNLGRLSLISYMFLLFLSATLLSFSLTNFIRFIYSCIVLPDTLRNHAFFTVRHSKIWRAVAPYPKVNYLKFVLIYH